jgi:hypothetical protein
MSDDKTPLGLMRLESPQRVEHVLTPAGWFGLEIDHPFPGETKPITLRVTISKDQLLGLLAQLEATRQQFGFPLPAVHANRTNIHYALCLSSSLMNAPLACRARFRIGRCIFALADLHIGVLLWWGREHTL